MICVALKNITKRFGDVVAVDGVSFEATEGEFLTLVGPSGCGKTTILRLIAGFEAPDSGDILFDGESVLNLVPEERSVGIVFQNYALFPHMNIFQNIVYGLKFVKHKTNKHERVEELLKLVGLEGLEKRRPDELSAGQRQRVALARALAPQPKVLLLDEPLSALDAKLRENLRLEIKRIQRELNITTIYVTHDQEEALAISDRVVVMSEGRVEQIGTPWEVYGAPVSTFVAGFIGRGNVFEAECERVGPEKIWLRLADGHQAILFNKKPLQCGQKVRFLVRPERLRLNNIAENKLAGIVRQLEFLGDSIVIHCESDGQRWLIKVSVADLKGLKAVEGQRLEVSFSARDGVIL